MRLSGIIYHEKVYHKSYTFDVKELGKINKFLSLLEESGVAEIIKGYVTDSTTGRPQYDI